MHTHVTAHTTHTHTQHAHATHALMTLYHTHTHTGADLKKRLSLCWDFLRTRLGSHLKKESAVATHCQSWLLSSRSDSRLARTCTHACPVVSVPLPQKYPGPFEKICGGSKCGGKDGTIGRGKKLSYSFYACQHCSTISCPKCIRTMWGQSEQVGENERKQRKNQHRRFICVSCSKRRCLKNHAMTCSECNSVQYFKLDLLHTNSVVQSSSADETEKKRIDIMTRRLCRNIDLYIGHVVRDKCQNSFWPDKLQELATKGITNQMLILSDFWKIFEGTYLRRINCDTGDRQSVEAHVVWSVCPPVDTLDVEDRLSLPADVVERQRAGKIDGGIRS